MRKPSDPIHRKLILYTLYSTHIRTYIQVLCKYKTPFQLFFIHDFLFDTLMYVGRSALLYSANLLLILLSYYHHRCSRFTRQSLKKKKINRLSRFKLVFRLVNRVTREPFRKIRLTVNRYEISNQREYRFYTVWRRYWPIRSHHFFSFRFWPFKQFESLPNRYAFMYHSKWGVFVDVFYIFIATLYYVRRKISKKGIRLGFKRYFQNTFL